MSTQYDHIADRYAAMSDAAILIRAHVEQPTVLKALGSIEGQSILDVACGTGMYARLFKQHGAARVVAVDIAPEMIALAQQLEEQAPLGVEYLTYDVAELPALGSFDVVTAVYLLHYAPSKEHLSRMCRGISQNLKPGGRFVTVVANPEFNPAGPNYAKYGFTFSQRVNAPEGSSVALVFLLEPPVMIHYKYWKRATYEGALAEAGFRTIVWDRLEPSPEAEAQFGRAFWEDYLRNPQARLIHCEK
jgi:ubiquinone/menaquinone biosynthesis C-methylase UbiE